MTQKANPSVNRTIEAFKTAGAIAYGGHGGAGFVREGANPTEISKQDPEIVETALNSFNESSNSSSLDVTINPGEAFVFGSWVCKDTRTTVSLNASTLGQVVSVGWNKGGSDDVIVGLDSDFSEATGDTDQKIPLFSFDTDSSGVTNVVDKRSFKQISADSIEQGESSGLDADTVDGAEASELTTVDVANDGSVVNPSTDKINFTDDLVASDSGSGTTSVTLSSKVLTRIFKAEDLNIHGKTLESGETITLGSDEGAVVSEKYTVNGTLNIEESGSITVI